MPRIARGLGDGIIYHILNRGNGKQTIFHNDNDYRVFIKIMKEAKKKYPIKIFSYCLMPNHFHFVLMPIQAEALSKFMQWLMTSYVRRYHSFYQTSGHIWQGRFKSFSIQEDVYLFNVLRYIESNPVRVGLVKSAREWPWSSHLELINKKNFFLIDDLPLKLPCDWAQFVDNPIVEKETTELLGCIKRCSPYGAPEWKSKISKELGLESTLRPIGRPRKSK